jgi:hypothetical protein
MNTFTVTITATATGETIPGTTHTGLTETAAKNLAQQMGTGEGYTVHITKETNTHQVENWAEMAQLDANALTHDLARLTEELKKGNMTATESLAGYVKQEAQRIVNDMQHIINIINN